MPQRPSADSAGVARPLSQHQLARELKARGFNNLPKKRINGKSTAVWWGLRLDI